MDNLVLWGHHLDEYQQMFALTKEELTLSLLEYSSGPNAVNKELQALNGRCLSCDPLFNLDISTLKSKTVLLFAELVQKISDEKSSFDFSHYGDLSSLIAKHREGLKTFFADYTKGKKEKRYQGIHAVKLDFADSNFDLALCSHYLFSGMEGQDLNFHLQVIRELVRVATEVRIFPINDLDGNPSAFLGPVLLQLQQENYGVELRQVQYNLQKKDNAMLRVWAQTCIL